ncbi:MAG: glycosyltransferase family 39 protein [Candidatus Omnitrophica bacterium]|nr:glycosyltransferase family 39 protein [Candidatus Omnitrophota bacterium]
MIKNKYFILTVLSIVFVLVRLPVIITSMDKICDFNELYIGTIAKELIEGSSLPLFDYQLTHIKGGTLLAGIFVIPFFWLFGQSYFVLKLVALLVSLIILAVTYLFLWRFFNKKIAIITGALMAISAPIYTIFSLMLYGKEYESILFTMIALFLFYRIFFQEASARDASHKELYFALFGLVSGLGMYFDYIFAVTLIYCLGFWFIFDKAFFARRGFRFFLIFFFVGLSPWIYYNLTHNFAAICIDDNYPNVPLRHLFLLNSLPEAARKLKDLLVYSLPDSFYFKGFKSIPGDAISYIYYIIFLISFSILFWSDRKTVWKLLCGIIPLKKIRLLPNSLYREVFILLYPLAFSLLYSFSYYLISKKSEYNFFGFNEYRFLIILYPFVFIILAIFLSRLWDWSKRGRRIAACLSVCISLFLVASGLIADYDLMTFRNFGRRLVYEGYNYDVLGIVIGERYGHSISKAVSAAGNIRQPHRAFVFGGIGWNMAWRFFRAKEYPDIDACIAHINKIDSGYRPFVFRGFGAFLGLQLKDIADAASYVSSIDKQYRPYVYEGIGWFEGWRFKNRFSLGIEQIDKIDAEYRPDYCRGLGELAGLIFGRNMSWCAELLRNADPKYRPYVLEGLTNKL